MADKQPKPVQKAPEPKPTPDWGRLTVKLLAAQAEIELARAHFRGDRVVIETLEPVLKEVRTCL